MNCLSNEKVFELGERRKVTMRVWLNDGARFTPRNCTWKLLFAAAAESDGTCETEQDGSAWLLSCIVEPKQRRTYKLQYGFALGEEQILRTVLIKVV